MSEVKNRKSEAGGRKVEGEVAAAKAGAAAERVAERVVELEIPLRRVERTGYQGNDRREFEVSLSREEWEIYDQLRNGLIAKGIHNASGNLSLQEPLRWILRRLLEATAPGVQA